MAVVLTKAGDLSLVTHERGVVHASIGIVDQPSMIAITHEG